MDTIALVVSMLINDDQVIKNNLAWWGQYFTDTTIITRGWGLRITKHNVITCAHVVNIVLKRDKENSDPLEALGTYLRLRFYGNREVEYDAEVIYFRLDDNVDLGAVKE